MKNKYVRQNKTLEMTELMYTVHVNAKITHNVGQ